MKPIILTADEVRAARAGTLTELRRPMKEQPTIVHKGIPYRPRRSTREPYIVGGVFGRVRHSPIRGPFGAPGALLWVRETWASADIMYQDHENDVPSTIAYRADKSAILYNAAKPSPVPGYDIKSWNWDRIKWRSPVTMPLWAARLTLATRAVRVEQVADAWTWIGVPEVLRRDGQPIPPREVQS